MRLGEGRLAGGDRADAPATANECDEAPRPKVDSRTTRRRSSTDYASESRRTLKMFSESCKSWSWSSGTRSASPGTAGAGVARSRSSRTEMAQTPGGPLVDSSSISMPAMRGAKVPSCADDQSTGMPRRCDLCDPQELPRGHSQVDAREQPLRRERVEAGRRRHPFDDHDAQALEPQRGRRIARRGERMPDPMKGRNAPRRTHHGRPPRRLPLVIGRQGNDAPAWPA